MKRLLTVNQTINVTKLKCTECHNKIDRKINDTLPVFKEKGYEVLLGGANARNYNRNLVMNTSQYNPCYKEVSEFRVAPLPPPCKRASAARCDAQVARAIGLSATVIINSTLWTF